MTRKRQRYVKKENILVTIHKKVTLFMDLVDETKPNYRSRLIICYLLFSVVAMNCFLSFIISVSIFMHYLNIDIADNRDFAVRPFYVLYHNIFPLTPEERPLELIFYSRWCYQGNQLILTVNLLFTLLFGLKLYLDKKIEKNRYQIEDYLGATLLTILILVNAAIIFINLYTR